MRRSLIHFWRMHLAVAAGAAVATAVLTGALVVGDSMRASLARLTLDRLGRVDLALAGDRMIGEEVAGRLAGGAGVDAAVPAIALTGSAVAAEGGARASGVEVWGIDRRFAALFPGSGDALELAPPAGSVFPPVAIGAGLAGQLGVEPGDDLLLSIARPSTVPRDTLLGDDDPAAALDNLRLTVASVLPDDGGAGRFSLDPRQKPPRVAYLPLAVLQRRLDAAGRVNALLVATGGEGGEELGGAEDGAGGETRPRGAERRAAVETGAEAEPPAASADREAGARAGAGAEARADAAGGTSPAPGEDPAHGKDMAAGSGAVPGEDAAAALDRRLAAALTLDDLGVVVRRVGGESGSMDPGAGYSEPAPDHGSHSSARHQGPLADRPSAGASPSLRAGAAPPAGSPEAAATTPAPGARAQAPSGSAAPGGRPPAGPHLQVESRELILRPPVEAAAGRAAADLGLASAPFLTYIADTLRVGEREVPYSTVTALATPVDPALGRLVLTDGSPAPALADDQVLLDAWAAGRLGAGAGDRLEMSYRAVGPDDELVAAAASFTVAGVVAMEGLAVDPALTPEVPGLTDAADMASWDPPFPVDLGRVGPEDEAYWDRWRGAPKAFVSLAAGRRLWASRFGDATAVRVAPVAGPSGAGTPTGPPPGAAAGPAGAATTDPSEALAGRLAAELDPAALGLAFRPVKAQGLAAATGSTDFTGLFIGFSVFLIIAAALLVVLLFGLSVERRAAEVGLLLAVGYPLGRVRRRLLAEAAVVAGVGAAAGTALAVGYAGGVLAALGSWWRPLVGTPFLHLAVEPMTLALGWLGSMALVVAVVALTLRRLRRLPAVALLRGVATPPEGAGRSARRPKLLAVGATAVAVALLAGSLVAGADASPGLFFGLGAALLTAGFAAFAAWCRGERRGIDALLAPRRSGRPGSGRGAVAVAAGLAAGNAARNPGRSLLAVVLVGSACFSLVAVAANRGGPAVAGTGEEAGRETGSGGYALVAESDVPLRRDLSDPEDLAELGLPEEAVATLADARVMPFRLAPGDDASCLNLYRPGRPRLLGAPAAFVERGGFRFLDAVGDPPAPWRLLDEDLGPGVVPAVGDEASVRWILHLGLGDELTVTDGRGEPLRLRIVALLQGSIFQSELVIGEAAFRRHFPDRGGFRFFLIDTADPAAATAALETGLARWGLDATPTAERLAAYHAVESMYLTTFQALGGLGLLLGTLGLGVVLARNVLERRGELATLRAFGFRRAKLGWLVVAESLFLLAVGVGAGTVAGLVAVAPRLVAGGAPPPWAALAGTLAAVFAVGLAASAAAVAASLRVPLLPALKAE